MINATFYRSSAGGLKGFLITGHSGFAQSGTDIVCAAVSSAAYMTANTITEVLNVNAKIDVSDAEMLLMLNTDGDETCCAVLEGLKLHVISLAQQYSQYIKVEISEV